LAQVCGEALGVDPSEITVIAGDTRGVALGLGAFASRQAVTAGSSVHIAAGAVRDKALAAAAQMLETDAGDLELDGGRVRVKGVPDLGVTLGEVARTLAGMPGLPLPAGLAPGLEAGATFTPDSLVYCNGTHVCEAEVDAETGAVTIVRYVAVHDSGRLINPMIVDGQVAGGAAHGIGNALLERMRFDAAGQPLTTNFADYLLPTATSLPGFDIAHMESPSPSNPLGVKGAGEGGTIPATAVIASAIEDALSPFGVTIAETPITPERIVALIAASRGLSA
jgi:carbon-monoxide dehydrogenase large subunit